MQQNNQRSQQTNFLHFSPQSLSILSCPIKNALSQHPAQSFNQNENQHKCINPSMPSPIFSSPSLLIQYPLGSNSYNYCSNSSSLPIVQNNFLSLTPLSSPSPSVSLPVSCQNLSHCLSIIQTSIAKFTAYHKRQRGDRSETKQLNIHFKTINQRYLKRCIVLREEPCQKVKELYYQYKEMRANFQSTGYLYKKMNSICGEKQTKGNQTQSQKFMNKYKQYVNSSQIIKDVLLSDRMFMGNKIIFIKFLKKIQQGAENGGNISWKVQYFKNKGKGKQKIQQKANESQLKSNNKDNEMDIEEQKNKKVCNKKQKAKCSQSVLKKKNQISDEQFKIQKPKPKQKPQNSLSSLLNKIQQAPQERLKNQKHPKIQQEQEQKLAIQKNQQILTSNKNSQHQRIALLDKNQSTSQKQAVQLKQSGQASIAQTNSFQVSSAQKQQPVYSSSGVRICQNLVSALNAGQIKTPQTNQSSSQMTKPCKLSLATSNIFSGKNSRISTLASGAGSKVNLNKVTFGKGAVGGFKFPASNSNSNTPNDQKFIFGSITNNPFPKSSIPFGSNSQLSSSTASNSLANTNLITISNPVINKIDDKNEDKQQKIQNNHKEKQMLQN